MDLIDDRAILDDEEDDESLDGETGEVRKSTNGANGHFDDSSEEEEDDDDEEAAAEVGLPQIYTFLGAGIDIALGCKRFHRRRR